MSHRNCFKVSPKSRKTLCLHGLRNLIPSVWSLVISSNASSSFFSPLRFQFAHFTYATKFPNFHGYIFIFSYSLHLKRKFILEINPQSEESKLGTLFEKHCQNISLSAFQENRFFVLITEICSVNISSLAVRSFYKLNGALFKHAAPTYPFWIVPTSDIAVPRPLIF